MKEKLKNKRVLLIENIIKQAEIYLIKNGEFAPFASKFTLNNRIVPVGYFDDNKIVDSKNAINVFQSELFKNKDVVLAAIGANVSIKVNNIPKDALLVIISNDGLEWEKLYYSYSISSGKVIWE